MSKRIINNYNELMESIDTRIIKMETKKKIIDVFKFGGQYSNECFNLDVEISDNKNIIELCSTDKWNIIEDSIYFKETVNDNDLKFIAENIRIRLLYNSYRIILNSGKELILNTTKDLDSILNTTEIGVCLCFTNNYNRSCYIKQDQIAYYEKLN